MAHISIRKQALEILTRSETTALTLHSRIGDFNRRRLLPVIERVLEEFLLPGQHITIDRLDLDLGSIPLERFEEVALERIEQELRKVLARSLKEGLGNPRDGVSIEPEEYTSLRLLDQYLVHGTLPFRGPRASGFSVPEFILELIEQEPAGLIATIKKRGHQSHVIERLVRQLDETVLVRLLGLVAPEQSELILAYVEDLQRLHLINKVVTLGDREFLKLLWFLILSYLLLDHGSQFNRKSFVKTTLEGIAESTGLEYRKLLAALVIGVDRTATTHALQSSLPAVIRELVRESALEAIPRETKSGLDPATEGVRLFEHFLVRGMSPPPTAPEAFRSLENLILWLTAYSPDRLAEALLDHGRDPANVRRLAQRLGEAALLRVLYILEPFNAELIATYLDHIRGVHRETPLIPVPEQPFTKLIWQLTLTYLVKDPGSQFNRKSFVRALLEGLADSENISFSDVLTLLLLALREMHRHQPSQSSLPAVVEELVTELATRYLELADSSLEFGGLSAASPTAGQPMSHRQFPDEIPAPESQGLPHLLPQPSEGSSSNQIEPAEAGEIFPDSTLRELILQTFSDSGKNAKATVERWLGERSFEQLSAALAVASRSDYREFLEIASMALAPVTATGRRSGELVAKAILEVLLENASGSKPPSFDRTIRLITEKLSDKTGISFKTLAGNFVVSLRGSRRTPASKSIERALLTSPPDTPPPVSPRFLPAGWHECIEPIRHLLRFGVLPWEFQLREPDPAPHQFFSRLPGFPQSVLEAVFTEGIPEVRRTMIRRAVRSLPDDAFRRILYRLLPEISKDNHPFRESLAAFETSAPDLPAFRERLLEAALDSQPLDLEAFSEHRPSEPETEFPPDPPHEAQLLKAALAERFRTGESRLYKTLSTDDLLTTLTSAHPGDARQFLRALRDAPTPRAAMLHEIGADRFSLILKTLSDDAPLLDTVISGLSGLTDVFPGVSPQRIREVVFLELVRLGDGTRVNERFFVQILRKLFRPPLNDQTRAGLNRLNVEIQGLPHLSRVAVSAFSSAVEFLGSIGERPILEDFPGPEEEPLADEAPNALVDSIFQNLADEVPPSVPVGGTESKTSMSPEQLHSAILELIRESPNRVYEFLRLHLPRHRLRERWVRELPETVLSRFVYLLSPSHHPWLADAAELLLSAWRETVPGEPATPAVRRRMWDAILTFLADSDESSLPIEHFIGEYLQRLAGGRASEDALPTIKAVLNRFGELARSSGRGKLVAILHRNRDRITAPWIPGGKTAVSDSVPPESRKPATGKPLEQTQGKTLKGKTAFRLGDEENAMTSGEPIYIGNAGLVLTSPFLPNFFQSLDYLVPDGEKGVRFRDSEALSRAVHLLQYLVDQQTAAPEPLLVLNKILCGARPETPVEPSIVPTEKELEMADRLLRSMIANWKAISSTSSAGLRETFLQREGRLEPRPENWQITVQRKTLDVLVDQIPWGFSVIFHGWMPRPVFVTW